MSGVCVCMWGGKCRGFFICLKENRREFDVEEENIEEEEMLKRFDDGLRRVGGRGEGGGI